MIKDEYDVVVVGAGPAGLRTSWMLAERGIDVLCVDKKQEIGTPVRCAEGVSDNVFEDLNIPVDEKWIAQHIESALVFSPDGSSIDVTKGHGFIIERKIFEKYLAEYASVSGAKIMAKTQAKELIKEDGEIKGIRIKRDGETKDIKCKMVVGADGVDSKIGKQAGLKTHSAPIDMDSGFQYEMTNLEMEDPHKLELHFGTDIAPRGYIWIFPKGENRANVGIGIAGNKDKSAKEYLDEWIEDHPEKFEDSSIIEVNSGGIPVGGFLEEMVADNLVLVGDAARQVNPIHGGGLREGMTAGDIAAEVIEEAFEKEDFSSDFLQKYEDKWWKKRGKKLKKVKKLRKALEDMDNNDFNTLANELTGEDIIEFTHGRKLTKLAKISMKTLGLVGSAKLLMG